VPPAVFAHGIVGRADLPIPEGTFGVAAAVVLVISFVALGALWSKPRLEDGVPERRLFRVPRVVDVLLGAIGVLAFGLSVYAGLAGTSSPRDNLLPTVVYVLFWVAIPFATLVFGDVFRLLSPWRAIGRAAGWIAARVGGAAGSEALPYPARLGRWPAAAGLLVFAACELVWADGRNPDVLAVLALVYLAVMLVGMSLYGVEAWTRNADTFGVWFSLLATLAPFARRERVVYARPPGAGAAEVRGWAGTVAVLCVAIGSTAFDSLKEGPLFNDVVPDLQAFFRGFGLSPGAALEAGFMLGLLASVALVSVIYLLAIEGMPRLAGRTRRDLARDLSHSLIPISAAYVVAHYFSLLAYQGQDTWRLASDPLGRGSDIFGTATSTIDYGVVSATGIWYVQVGALIAGHVVALVLAHDRALALYGNARGAARSQIVMLVLMVCFTGLGLSLLSEANG
jgi:hypothetical protein